MRTLTTAGAVTDLLDGGALRAVFQPIVDLASGETVAYEALTRGPTGSPLEAPDRLFAAARRAGIVADLDWECRGTALAAALEAGLTATLFVNAEPQALTTTCPPHLRHLVARAARDLRMVVEVTERALTGDPAGLLHAVATTRAAGAGIALDDVGAEPASLALMPFLDPEVIKLDLSLVQQRTDAEIAGIVNAVSAHAERTGAAVLAEGIETPAHLERALVLGATLGQGWMYGRPGPLPAGAGAPMPGRFVAKLAPSEEADLGPFALASANRPSRRATKALLLPMSHHFEREAVRSSEPPVVLAAFQHARHFRAATARRYGDLARGCSFVGALGAEMASEPAPGVRGGVIGRDDPLGGEWVVAVIGPHFAGALVAKDAGDSGPEPDRRFDYVITHDRALVLGVARTLMRRIVAESAVAPG